MYFSNGEKCNHNQALVFEPISQIAQGRKSRGWAQGHVPSQYLEQPVVLPLKYFQQIWGLTKWVPPQYLAPSYGPDIECSFGQNN